MQKKFPTNIYSEIGELEAVIIHSPGQEVENMTPQNAERSLYSDILNLSVVTKEYEQLKGVLNKFSTTFEVRDLLRDILDNEKVKANLINRICRNEPIVCIKDTLLNFSADELSRIMLEGFLMKKNNLTNFLSKERYSLLPLHNFFYTRDAAISIYDSVFVGRMASTVRLREALIMEAIFDFHPAFSTKTINPLTIKPDSHKTTLEGGDILIAREDILLIGIGSRTSPEGVDFIIEQLKDKEGIQHILVQELPDYPESFIHLDMVFTFISQDLCLIYEPVIMKMNKYQTVHITVENGNVESIKEVKNLIEGLKSLGMDIKPVVCGGTDDPWIQEREQWHSGANIFALAPAKVIGYARNSRTIEELNKHGLEVLRAKDIITGKVNHQDYSKYVITLDGSELPRGGGGARCMTLPVSRKSVAW